MIQFLFQKDRQKLPQDRNLSWGFLFAKIKKFLKKLLTLQKMVV